MSLEAKVMPAMKEAMKAKDKLALEALRAIKAAILLAKTESGDSELSEDAELKMLQKLVKQRRDSADLYKEQGRADLAEVEEKQAEVIAQFLPEQMSEEELTEAVKTIIAELGAEGMKDMGKVMGVATKKLAGKTEGKLISLKVKELLG